MFKCTLAGLLLMISMQSQAALFTFDCITDNSGSCDSVASLLSLDITASGLDDTLFTFSVADGANLAVKSIYFDDGNDLLAGLTSAFSYSDVDEVAFQTITSGGNLPAGNSIGFVSTLSTDATPPSGDDKNGIDNGEWLGITFAGLDSSLLLSAIALGDFNIGLHMGSLEGGYSEAASLSVSTVPVPAAIWLFGTGLLGFVGMSRRTEV